MSPKVFLALLALTVVAAGAALLTALAQPGAAPVRYVDEPAFPALRANPDAVAKVALTTPEGSFTLVRETGDRWSALERYGYAVDEDQVRALVVALADMRLIEAKTSLPERYGRLEVEDVGAADAKSRLLRLESADGEVLAEAIFGKQQHRLTGHQAAGTYLRRPGEAQSWLASGAVAIDPTVVDWLDARIVDLAPAQIARIEIRPDSGAEYVVRRGAPDEPLQFADLEEGETLKPDAGLDRLAAAFADLRFEDVKPRSELAWPEAHHSATAAGFDGVELTVQLARIDDEPWAIIDARQVAAARPAPANTAAEEPANEAEGSEAVEIEDPAAAEEEGAAEPLPLTADEINQRVQSWAYKVPGLVFDRLTKPRSEWLEDAGTS
ncbi:MAG TPA: DUF4340 domain-containing protein [Geminicoccaceae bacterium]|nr:DUF4340 domain-containing protein [Geminicoccaceae bacterium]